MSHFESYVLDEVRRFLFEALQRHDLLKDARIAAGALTLAGGALAWVVRYSPPPPPLWRRPAWPQRRVSATVAVASGPAPSVRRCTRRRGEGVEVDASGAVECFFGCPGPCAGGQKQVFVLVLAGPVDGKATEVGGAAAAEPPELEEGAIAQAAVDVAKVGSDANVDPSERRPVGAGVVVETSAMN